MSAPKAPSSVATKAMTAVVLLIFGALGVWAASWWVPSPWHYLGALFPLVLITVLGYIANRFWPSP